MNRLCKSLTILFLIAAILVSTVFAAYASFDSTSWDSAEYYGVLDYGDASNSDLCYAGIKVKYERETNRIRLLFLLGFEKLNDINLCGVIMNFNGMGNIKLLSDGTAEYNNDIYFAEIDNEIYDKNSLNVVIETTVGIKSGIPDNVIMDVFIVDTDGVKSNRYSVDITEETDEEPSEEKRTSKTQSEKQTKEKTTKAKTTKVKTTKVKTTKIKTSKSQKIKTSKTKTSKVKESDDIDEDEEPTVIDSEIDSSLEVNNKRKNIMLILGSAATIVAVAAGCAAGIKNRKKDNDGGH